MGQTCNCRMAPSLIWFPVFLLEVGSVSSLSLLSRSSSKVPPSLWVLSISQLPGCWCILECAPQPPISRSFLFSLFLLALRVSVLFPHPVPDQVPLSWDSSSMSTFPFISLHPSPCVIAFFSFQNGTVLTWSLHLIDFSAFCGLYLCFLGILYFFFCLISTY